MKREQEREGGEEERGKKSSNTGKNRSCQFFVSLGGCTGHEREQQRNTNGRRSDAKVLPAFLDVRASYLLIALQTPCLLAADLNP